MHAPCLSIRKSSPSSWPMCVSASHPRGPAHHSQRIQRPPWFLCQCGGASNATSDLAVLSRVATGACAGTVPGDELHGIRAGSQGLSALRVVDRASFCRCEQAGRARCGGKRRPCTRLRAPM